MRRAFTLIQLSVWLLFFSTVLYGVFRSNSIQQLRLEIPPITRTPEIVMREYLDKIVKYSNVKGALPKNFGNCIDSEADRVFSTSFYSSIATTTSNGNKVCLDSRENPINYFIDPDPRYLTQELRPFGAEYQPYINPGLFCGRAVGFAINDKGTTVNNVAFVIVSPGSDGKFNSGKVNGVYTISGDDISLYKTVNEMYVALNCDQKVKSLANINPLSIIPISRLPQMFAVSTLSTGRRPHNTNVISRLDFLNADYSTAAPFNGFYNNELDPDIGQMQFYIPVDLGYALMADYGKGCASIVDNNREPISFNLLRNYNGQNVTLASLNPDIDSSHYVRRVLFLYTKKNNIIKGIANNVVNNVLDYSNHGGFISIFRGFYDYENYRGNGYLTDLPAVSDFRFVSFGRFIKLYIEPKICLAAAYTIAKPGTPMLPCRFDDWDSPGSTGFFLGFAITMKEMSPGVLNQQCYTDNSALVDMYDVAPMRHPYFRNTSPFYPPYARFFSEIFYSNNMLYEFYESQQAGDYGSSYNLSRRLNPDVYLTQPATVHGYSLLITNRAHHAFNDQTGQILFRYRPSDVLVDSGLPKEIMVEMPLTMKSVNNNNTVNMYSGVRQFSRTWSR